MDSFESLEYEIKMEEMRKQIFENKCKKKALEKILVNYYYDKMLNDPDKYLIPEISEKNSENLEKWVNNKKGMYRYALITVNPKNGVDIHRFHLKVIKACKKVYIEKYMYCFEWRGREKDKNGFHCHIKIWIKKGKRAYAIKGEFYNTFKNYVGNHEHINMRYSNIDGCFENYIKGEKDGKLKEHNSYDIEMRKYYGFKELYTGHK